MYYIVETEQQLNRLYFSDKECYIRIIPMNDEYHSILTSPCLVYFKTPTSKGYMFTINHGSNAQRAIYINKTDADSNSYQYSRGISTMTLYEVSG